MIRKVKKNIDEVYAQANATDTKQWLDRYKEAHQFCKNTGDRYSIDPFVVASVVSALSPRNKRHKNLIDTITVIEAWTKWETAEDVTVSTFHSNKRKAFDILNGKKEITADSKKTYAFVKNISWLDDNYVTVDVRHLRACFWKTMQSCGALAYEQIEKITKEKATKEGLAGYELQAIIWGSVKRNWEK